MNEQNSRSRSPFAELSFSEQQEMWRIWRAKPLDYQEFKAPAPAPKPEPVAEVAPPPAPMQPFAPPSHKNLDRVHARIAAAAANASAFRPLT